MNGIRTKKEIEAIIKFHDENTIGIHPNTEYIKGMIMGLAYAIRGRTKKPNCIEEKAWEQLQKETGIEIKEIHDAHIKKKKANNPKTLEDILGYKEEGGW